MRAFYKLCAKLAAAMIAIGIILTLIGLMNGGNTNSLSFGPISNRKGWDIHRSDISSSTHSESEERVIDVNSDTHSIDIDIDFGEVAIKEGDEFKVYTSRDNLSYMKSSQKNGTWTIESKRGISFSIFGISIGNNGLSHNKKDKITIIIPKDFRAKRINIELGAGKIAVEQLRADKISLDVGAGTLLIDKLYAYESADMLVGAGEIDVDTIEASNVDIDCGVGSVKIDGGSLIGDNRIKCGVGNVDLELTGNQEDYNYYVDSGIGNVIINEEKYSFTTSTRRTNDLATSEFDIECGVGNINIQIKE